MCSGSPHTHTHTHTHTQTHKPTDIHTRRRIARREPRFPAHTHRLMTEEALTEVKYLQEMRHVVNWLWWAGASTPWCFPFFFSYLSLNFHFICTKIIRRNPRNWAFLSVWFISHKSSKNIPNRWCMAYCYYKYANLENPRWGVWFIISCFHFTTTQASWHLQSWEWMRMSTFASKTIYGGKKTKLFQLKEK